jgi:pimeloyl-ACP methyl ester carboxylesterase
VRRGWKILIGALVALAILLAVNTIVLNQETKAAEVTVSGGRILELPSGALQVVEQGPTVGQPTRRKAAAAPPIVLLHGFGASLHWWDRMVPLLARRHRVVRIDLLGFGGSEKPKSGYSMEDQGRLVALALGKLHVRGAVVVGHSLGFSVATALAAESSDLVDRLVDIDAGPDPSFGDLPFLARLASAPVIGQALRRVSPDFAIEDGYDSAFAPGYDVGNFSDQIVDDYRAMTYTSYDRSPAEVDDYQDAMPLDQRNRAAAVPLLVIFGEEDQLYDDPSAAAHAYGDVPGARITMIPGAGHTPIIEKPAQTSRLVLDFAAEKGGRG